MNINKQFQMLVTKARNESVPRVDVSVGVLAILSTKQERPMFVSERHWAWLALFSSAVAASITVIAVISYYLSASPLVEISETISWVMR